MMFYVIIFRGKDVLGLWIFLMCLLIVMGLFFVTLGLLFIDYNITPLRLFVKKEDVFVNYNLGVQIMIPGCILLFLAGLVYKYYTG